MQGWDIMTDQFKEQLLSAGVDVSGAMNRFMNNAGLYEKFLRKFPADPSYQNLLDSVQANDPKEAFRAAHTLKGVAGNLGFENLLTYVVPLVEVFRDETTAAPEAQLQGMKDEYQKLCSIISSN